MLFRSGVAVLLLPSGGYGNRTPGLGRSLAFEQDVTAIRGQLRPPGSAAVRGDAHEQVCSRSQARHHHVPLLVLVVQHHISRARGENDASSLRGELAGEGRALARARRWDALVLGS